MSRRFPANPQLAIFVMSICSKKPKEEDENVE